MNPTNEIPVNFPNQQESVYAGFWERLGANVLDIFCYLPVTFLIEYISSTSKTSYFVMIIPHLLFIYYYNIYCVQKYGGTLGKLIVGIKIININGKKATETNAWLRFSVSVVLILFITTIKAYSVSKIPEDLYTRLNRLDRSTLINQQIPILFNVFSWASNLWAISELITLLANEQKRAIHDFLGDTIVVRSQYLDIITTWRINQEKDTSETIDLSFFNNPSNESLTDKKKELVTHFQSNQAIQLVAQKHITDLNDNNPFAHKMSYLLGSPKATKKGSFFEYTFQNLENGQTQSLDRSPGFLVTNEECKIQELTWKEFKDLSLN